MANKFIRSTREVKDVNKLSDNVGDENDIFSQTDGKVFIKTRDGGYKELGGGVSNEELEPIKTDVTQLNKDVTTLKSDSEQTKTDVTNLKSENTKLKNRVSDLETSNEEKTTKISELETKSEDFETRIKALENPPTTE